MKNQEEKETVTEFKGERLYTKDEVKTKKTFSLIEGIVLGAIGLLTTGVIASRVSNANIIDSTNDAIDKGIEKVKTKFKKTENTEELDN
jgi:hypothetical protein